MFDHHGNRIPGRVHRRETDEQRVVSLLPRDVLGLVRPRFPVGLGDSLDLHGAGLAGHFHALFLDRRPSGRSPFAVDHIDHALDNHRQVFGHQPQAIMRIRRFGGLLRLAVHHRAGQPGRDLEAAIGEPGGHHRQLQGRHQDIALADTGNQGFTLLPGFASGRPFPFPGWHQSLVLVGQVQAQFFAKPQALGHGGDAVDAGTLRRFIEIHVTRLGNGVEQVEASMTAPFPAIELGLAQPEETGTEELRVGGNGAFFKGRQGDHHLEGRTGRILAADRLVDQG